MARWARIVAGSGSGGAMTTMEASWAEIIGQGSRIEGPAGKNECNKDTCEQSSNIASYHCSLIDLRIAVRAIP